METMDHKPNICVIADDPIMSESLRQRLSMEGFNVDLYDRAHIAFERIQRKYCDIMLCDMQLPDMNAIDFYNKIADEERRVPPFIFMAAHDSHENDVDSMGIVATDYVTKPFDPEILIGKLKAISVIPNKPRVNTSEFDLGISPALLAIEGHLKKIAPYHETPFLITGESGTGKEVVARHLHQEQKGNGPFIAVNCSAIPEGLIESELFGHEKGSFTGASRLHKGVFEQANNGTLLLDEIAEMPLFLQAKLLRVIQEKTIRRVGGEKDIKISLRMIFATNKNLEQYVRDGLFREDLYFRINVIHTHIPELHKRKEDILWLAERFLKEHQGKYANEKITLHDSAKQALLNHQWPGNVRELKHAIERACIMANNSIIRAHDILINPNKPDRAFGTSSTSLKEYLESREKDKISSTLLQHNGSISLSAEHLNICRKSLWEKMKKYNIEK